MRLLVEERRLLEDAQASGPDREQVEELHDNEVDEVDGRGFVCHLGDIIGVVFRV